LAAIIIFIFTNTISIISIKSIIIIIYNMRYEIISLIFKTNQKIGWLNSSSPKTKRRSKYESYPYKKIAANVLRRQVIPCT